MDGARIRDFAVKTVVAIALAALALLVWKVHDVLLLLFAAILVATVLRAAGAGVRKLLPIGEMAGLAIGTLLIVGFLAAVFALFGQQASGQFSELADSLPRAWSMLEDRIGSDRLSDMVDEFSPGASTVAGMAQTIFGYVTTALSGLLLAVLGGLYLAVNPRIYRDGALKLLPAGARGRVGEAADASAQSLRAWLVGQLMAMTAVGVLTFLALTLIGVPMALALGLIAALLDFVPLIGPIVAAIPGVLIALTVGVESALLAAGAYLAIQQFEGNVMAPLVMRKAVDIPPAVTLFSLFLLGGIFGPMGILIGGPLTVVVFVMVRKLWVEEALDTPVG